jgi:hypothetical protein
MGLSKYRKKDLTFDDGPTPESYRMGFGTLNYTTQSYLHWKNIEAPSILKN